MCEKCGIDHPDSLQFKIDLAQQKVEVLRGEVWSDDLSFEEMRIIIYRLVSMAIDPAEEVKDSIAVQAIAETLMSGGIINDSTFVYKGMQFSLQDA